MNRLRMFINEQEMLTPLSSFGDFIACSGHIDEKSAEYIFKVVSDGIIAKSYSKRL